MRFIFLMAGLLCFNLLSAQDTLRLLVDNPEPRIGDEVELSFSFNFFTDDLKSQLSDEIEMTNSSSVFGGQSDKFTRVIEFKRAGKHKIGPFKFDFNGRMIMTDSIVITVAEKLPFEEGVWIRLTSDQEGNKFLIVEQLIKNQSDYSENEDGFSYTVGGKMDDNTEFVEIDEIKENGVKINFRQSRSNTRTNDSDDIFAPGLSYSFKMYQIKFDENYDGTFTLKKKHLKNFPKKTSFTEINISK